MKTIIFTLTKGGKDQGLRIKKFLPEVEVYTMPQFAPGNKDLIPIEEPLRDLVKRKFEEGDLLIFIMATGIVVRMIAPFLEHKGKDPAILVMDEAGKNIISLLSGHLGGANEQTLKLAALLNSNPVITTASDVKGIVAVDLFAKENNFIFLDWEKTKKITAHLVNGGKVGLYSEVALRKIPQNYNPVKDRGGLSKFTFGIAVSNRELSINNDQVLQLYPRNLVVGMGCRRDIPEETILEEINLTLKELELSIHSISKITTVDVKKDEIGIQRTAEILKVPLEIIDRQQIKTVETAFEASSFVRETIGVVAVSGPCAYLGSNKGKLLLEKRIARGVTISIAEMNNCGVK